MAAKQGNKTAQKGDQPRAVNLNIRIESWRRDDWKRRAAACNMTLTDWLLCQVER